MLKKTLQRALCAALSALTLCLPTFAIDTGLNTIPEFDGYENHILIAPAPDFIPETQGDFLVEVNGAYVTFTDAVPKIRNDRSCLPFVAVFEQLGFAEADMTWDHKTKTVTATKDDLTVSLTIGKNEITLIRNGETTVIETDVAPYIEPSLSRTYIPFGLVADALGYNVGWDDQLRAVIIDDVDAILDSNKETYELMNKYLDYSRSYAQKNCEVEGSYAMYMGMADVSSMLELLCSGEYSMLMSGSTDMQFTTDMYMDMAMTMDDADVTSELLGEDADLFPLFIDMELRADMKKGEFYLQSGTLSELMDQPGLENAWYKLNLAELFDSLDSTLGMDYASLMEMSLAMTEMDFEACLETMLKGCALTDASFTTRHYLDTINALLADSAFERSGSTYTSTMETGGITTELTLYTSNSKVTGYALTMSGDPNVLDGLMMEVEVSMQDDFMEAAMGIGMEGLMELSFSMEGTYNTTKKSPATEPPRDAVVIDLMDLMGLPMI